MIIGLCTELSDRRDWQANVLRLTRRAELARAAGVDLLLFGEAFLQGTDAFKYDYAHDVEVAVGLHGVEIMAVRKVAREQGLALGFGFYENEKGGLYSSYLVLDKSGQTVGCHQRVTPYWEAGQASADYRTGSLIQSFTLAGKRFAILLTDDLCPEWVLPTLVDLDAEVDFFLHAVSCNESLEGGLPTRSCLFLVEGEGRLFSQKSEILAKPILQVASIREGWQENFAALVLQQGREQLCSVDRNSGMRLFALENSA